MIKYTSRVGVLSTSFVGRATLINRPTTIASFATQNDRDDDTPPLTALQKKIAEAKKTLEWRTPMFEKKEQWYSKFKVFAPEKNEDTDIITFLQQPIDLTVKGRQERRERKRIHDERFMQQFIPERHQTLGNDLAAAHFLVHRGGSVKFVDQPKWVKRNKDFEYDLPSRYHPKWLIEAIRCDDMELYYEGLENLRRLHHLKFLSFRNVKPFDDWCLDRISGLEYSALEVLDLSGTQVTERGLCALYRIPTLKMLIVDDSKATKGYELTCALLEELMPEIKITNASVVH